MPIKKKTRSASTSQPTEIPEFSDSQTWVTGQADSQGWFWIAHVKSGKFLTSSEKGVIIDEKYNSDEAKGKKILVKTKVTGN